MRPIPSRSRTARPIGWVLMGALAMWGCSKSHNGGSVPALTQSQSSPTTISPAAQAYLDRLLEVMQAYSINKATIDWAGVRSEVFTAAGVAQTIPDTHPAIAVALRLLNDHESFYTSRNGGTIGPPPVGGCGAATLPTFSLPDTVGYVKVERTGLGQSAESIQKDIKTADRPGLSGWIVDLRGNGGGNMWPMIAGVGPVLGEGIIGWIVYNDREYEREYRDGAALSLSEAFARVNDPYTLLKPYPRVAVLTDGLVNSAGEAIAVYFRGRPDTRSFGTPTCGHHHLLQDFGLSDGATLWLTTAQHEDRMRTRYAGPISPDEIISDWGQAVDRAIAWLQSGR